MRKYLNFIGITSFPNLEYMLRIALSNQLIARALKIALVVGIVLNLINQGEFIITLDLSNINFLKMLLTFLVPFCVSMYTAITMKMKFPIGEIVLNNITLKCKNCSHYVILKKDEFISSCPNCHDKSHWKLTFEKDNLERSLR